MASSSNSYSSTIFTEKPDSGTGVVNQATDKLGVVKVGKGGQSTALGRLAHAIARLPNAPSSRGNASNLFLP